MGAERFGVKGYWPPTRNINSRGCLCEFIMSESMLLNVWICNRNLHKFTQVPSSELGSQEWKQTSTWLNWNSLLVTCVALLLCYSHCYLFWLDLVIFGSVLHLFLWKTIQVFMLFHHLENLIFFRFACCVFQIVQNLRFSLPPWLFLHWNVIDITFYSKTSVHNP